MASMTKRERLLTALRRDVPDRVPKWIQPGAHLQELVESNTDSVDPAAYFDLDITEFVRCSPSTHRRDFSDYHADVDPKRVNEWGVIRWDEPAPLRGIQSADDVARFPFPDVGAKYRFKKLRDQITGLKSRGLPVINGYVPGTYEQLCALRGMEDFLVDLIQEPEFLQPCLDTVSDHKAQIVARYAESGVDVIWTGDDLGSETRMLMAPETWRKHLKSCVRKIVDAAKSVNPEILVAFHSDGFIEPVIGDLIEVGVDVLQAVQPECMDVGRLKREFGSRLAFWGTVSTQDAMAFGTAEEVEAEVVDRIHTMGTGGGLCVGPSHTLEPPTPWENVVAFACAAEAHGRY
jgi:uroporphyrinogen decarboxylase